MLTQAAAKRRRKSLAAAFRGVPAVLAGQPAGSRAGLPARPFDFAHPFDGDGGHAVWLAARETGLRRPPEGYFSP
jgi:hypothetical protein